jgi:hypothetical protein
VGVLNVRIG